MKRTVNYYGKEYKGINVQFKGASGNEPVTEVEVDVEEGEETEEIVNVIREVVEDRMGLHLGRVEVHIKHAPYPEDHDDIRVIGTR